VYTLYYSPGSASMVVHLALLELGVPFRLEKLDLERDEQHGAEYLKLNPRGQVPTLVIDGRPYFESAALLMILAERHPEARLAPPAGSALRPDWYQWIVFFASALGPVYRQWFYPSDLGFAAHPPALHEALREKIEGAWSLVDAHLAAGGPYLLARVLGRGPAGAHVHALVAQHAEAVTEWPALRRYADLMRSRPSWAKLYEVEGLTEWRA